jgi:hypothetical protein
VPTPAEIYNHTFPSIHQEFLRRREKSHYHQLPTPWPGLRRLYVHGVTLIVVFNPLSAVVDSQANHPSTVYDLITNIIHESVAGTTRDKDNTAWKVYLRAGSGGGDSEKWYMIHDLNVEETRKEMIFLGEAVVQVCVL